ncbi:HU family DNA-binding protein [Gluconobacter oxydans]|uniref:HU family DNA-binding protein n=1 Tax=Gluconobacter oxydans TaxID=442 RepID=UPI0009B9BCE2|nr:HU family DNA-binding protein [Gluconobacter oxydans]
MKTSDLIDQIAQSTDRSKTEVREILDALLDGILAATKKGEDVTLTGFGKFSVRQLAARQGRNPATGESIEIPASRKLAFSAGKVAKDALALAKIPAKKTAAKTPVAKKVAVKAATPKTACRKRV